MSPIQWKIEYYDGTSEEGFDNLSKNAFNNENVRLFYLITDYYITLVNLEDGTITFGIKTPSNVSEFTFHSPYGNKAKYRLIYYRKRAVSYTLGTQEFKDEEDIPFIGIQTFFNDRNYKKIFSIADKIIIESE